MIRSQDCRLHRLHQFRCRPSCNCSLIPVCLPLSCFGPASARPVPQLRELVGDRDRAGHGEDIWSPQRLPVASWTSLHCLHSSHVGSFLSFMQKPQRNVYIRKDPKREGCFLCKLSHLVLFLCKEPLPGAPCWLLSAETQQRRGDPRQPSGKVWACLGSQVPGPRSEQFPLQGKDKVCSQFNSADDVTLPRYRRQTASERDGGRLLPGGAPGIHCLLTAYPARCAGPVTPPAGCLGSDSGWTPQFPGSLQLNAAILWPLGTGIPHPPRQGHRLEAREPGTPSPGRAVLLGGGPASGPWLLCDPSLGWGPPAACFPPVDYGTVTGCHPSGMFCHIRLSSMTYHPECTLSCKPEQGWAWFYLTEG